MGRTLPTSVYGMETTKLPPQCDMTHDPVRDPCETNSDGLTRTAMHVAELVRIRALRLAELIQDRKSVV